MDTLNPRITVTVRPDPEAYLADILARIADHRINRIDELLPGRWRPSGEAKASIEKAA